MEVQKFNMFKQNNPLNENNGEKHVKIDKELFVYLIEKTEDKEQLAKKLFNCSKYIAKNFMDYCEHNCEKINKDLWRSKIDNYQNRYTTEEIFKHFLDYHNSL
jgi:hypothetical protein